VRTLESVRRADDHTWRWIWSLPVGGHQDLPTGGHDRLPTGGQTDGSPSHPQIAPAGRNGAHALADQRSCIDRLVESQLDPIEMHDYLAAAMNVQDARRDWILTNWPHLVELEKISRLTHSQLSERPAVLARVALCSLAGPSRTRWRSAREA
jgi:hypothetical protein